MSEIILDVRNLTHHFGIGKKLSVKALDNVSFAVKKGEIFGLVGESGSGKSTVARCVMNILKPTSGEIFCEGINVLNPKEFKKNKKQLEASRQLIFQDSASSLNGRMTVREIVSEPMKIHKVKPPRGTFDAEAEFQLFYVGLDKSLLDKYPTELSGGMRQRVAIARALTMEPRLLVADEPISSLDVSVQAQIINLFAHLRCEHNCSILFIAHDLSVVRYLCDRVGVMCKGKLVELAPVEKLFASPRHPYTKALLSSIPIPDPRLERERVMEKFDYDPKLLSGKLREVSEEHFVLWGDEE
ncbi:MAG: ABC transporter ATP-binding protein [Oscillospiraceae bacterium]|nr:ABC transporter ATP-binding protein [Oscillospiraceae bacterium]